MQKYISKNNDCIKGRATSCGQLGLEMSVKPSGQTVGGCFSISTTLGIAWFSNKIDHDQQRLGETLDDDDDSDGDDDEDGRR